MPNLTADDVLRLSEIARETITIPTFSIKHLSDRSERTLIVGVMDFRDGDRIMRHVYIRNGNINVHDYLQKKTQIETISHTPGETVLLEDVIPKLLVAPSATDLEFAELLLKKKTPFNFASMGKSYDIIGPVDGIYYGYTLTDSSTRKL